MFYINFLWCPAARNEAKIDWSWMKEERIEHARETVELIDRR